MALFSTGLNPMYHLDPSMSNLTTIYLPCIHLFGFLHCSLELCFQFFTFFIMYTTSACNLGFIFYGHLTFTDQISSLSKSCCYHIHHIHCINPYLSSKTAYTIATSVIHTKLDYCNSFYHYLPKSQITHFQQIQNSLACVAVMAPMSCHIASILCSVYRLAQDNWMHTWHSHSSYIYHSTFITPYHCSASLQHQLFICGHSHCGPPSLSLLITDLYFCYTSPYLWIQLPVLCNNRIPISLPQTLILPSPGTSSPSVNSPLSSIMPSLFDFQLKTCFSPKCFQHRPSFSQDWLHWFLAIYHFFWAYLVFVFSFFSFISFYFCGHMW